MIGHSEGNARLKAYLKAIHIVASLHTYCRKAETAIDKQAQLVGFKKRVTRIRCQSKGISLYPVGLGMRVYEQTSHSPFVVKVITYLGRNVEGSSIVFAPNAERSTYI